MIVDTDRYSQDQFLSHFKTLIDQIIVVQTEGNEKQNLDDLFTQHHSQERQIDNTEPVREFISKLNLCDFDNGLIPYNHITLIIFTKITDDVTDRLFEMLKTTGIDYFNSTTDEVNNDETRKTYYKIIRHIELAAIQKTHLFTENQRQLEELNKRYQALEQLNEELNIKNNSLQSKIEKIDQEAKSKYDNMVAQFISILGIFAAILMGVFGSVQAFTSLFNNANQLSYGKILILSSIGASSVIVILFFLLTSLGKMVGKRISSSNEVNSTVFEKYPFLFASHGLLIFVALIGVSAELSNVTLTFAWQGLWWLLPIIWLIFFIWGLNKNSVKLFKKSSAVIDSPDNSSNLVA